jgi:hypothetical protein
MADYELLSLWNEWGIAGATHYMNFVTVLFAFLIVVYLVGDKIEAFYAWCLTFLFTCFSIMMGVSATNSFSRGMQMREVLQARMQGDPELTAIVGTGDGTPLLIVSAGVLFLSYVLAVGYLIHKRRSSRSE